MAKISSQTVTKSKPVTFDEKKKWFSGNEQIKIQKIVLNQLAKHTHLNKFFKLVLRLSKAIPNIS